jgi:TolA-binding protein
MKSKTLFIITLFLLAAILTPISFLEANLAKEEETVFMAKKAFEDGFYEVSLGLLERFLNDYPDSARKPEVNLLIAQCYLHQSRFLDALAKFEALLNEPEAKSIKDAVYYGIAEVHFKGNNFSQAASYYKNVISEFPNSSYAPMSYYSLGWSLFELQKYKEALDYFLALEKKYPKELQANDASMKIIECLYNLKDYAALKERVIAALKLFAKDPVRLSYLNFYLGEAYYNLGNYQEAVNAYSKAQLNSQDELMLALCRMDMAWSYLKLKDYKEAEDAFSKVKPGDLDKKGEIVFILGKALLMMETNRVNEAKDLYSRLAEISGDSSIAAQSYIGKGDALYNLADYQGAINSYRQALEKLKEGEENPDTIEKLHYNLAWALYKQGDSVAAIKEFEWMIRFSKDDTLKASVLCQLGDIYQDTGDYAQSMKEYNLVLTSYAGSSYSDYAQYQLITTALKLSDYKGAGENLSKLINAFPASKYVDQAVYRIASAYFQKEDYKSCQEILTEYKDKFNDSSFKQEAVYLLGSCLYNQKDYKGASQEFKDLLKIPGLSQDLAEKAEYEIANCLYELGEEKEALSRFKSLRAKYPDSKITPDIIWWLGEYYYQHNEMSLARRYFLSIIQDFSKSNLLADAYYALGLTFAQESRTPEALESFNKVVALDNGELKARAKIAMADIFAGTENADQAVNLYKEALKDYPDLRSQIYSKLAKVLLNNGDYVNAIDYYGMSLSVATAKDKPGLHLRMAEAYEAAFKLDQAIEEYLKALESAKEDKDFTVKLLLRLGKIYEDKGNSKQAISYYKKIYEMSVPESEYAQERINLLKSRSR